MAANGEQIIGESNDNHLMCTQDGEKAWSPHKRRNIYWIPTDNSTISLWQSIVKILFFPIYTFVITNPKKICVTLFISLFSGLLTLKWSFHPTVFFKKFIQFSAFHYFQHPPFPYATLGMEEWLATYLHRLDHLTQKSSLSQWWDHISPELSQNCHMPLLSDNFVC